MRWINRVLVLFAVAFLVWAGYSLAGRWEGGAVRVAWSVVAGGVLVLGAAQTLQGLGWRRLLEVLSGTRAALTGALSVFMSSQIGRYLPGKIGLPAVRILGAERLGVRMRSAGTSVLVELLSWLATGSLVSFTGILLAPACFTWLTALPIAGRIALVAACVIGLLVLLVLDRRRLPARLLRLLGIEGAGPLVPVALVGYHLGFWLLVAAHGAFLLMAVGVDAGVALGVAPVFVLSIILGFLALPFPAGVGVREAVLMLTLEGQIGGPAALSAALICRGSWLVADFGTWAFWGRLDRRAGAASSSKEEGHGQED
jgi:glycosyltransferase 2 family protein